MAAISKEAQRLIDIYRRAQQELIKTIADKEAKGNVTDYKRSLLEQIDRQINELDEASTEWVSTAIPSAYQEGLQHTIDFFKGQEAEAEFIKYSFSRLHTEAIEILMHETLDELHGANHYARSIIKQATFDAVTQKIAQGQTVVECKKNIIQALTASGITGIETRNGKTMALDVYATTVARSKTRETTNTALINQLSGLGYDLVKISSNNTSCPICAPLQGRVYSISGSDPKYPPLSKAFRGPYANIHPNCNHVLVPYVEALSNTPELDKALSIRPFNIDERSKAAIDSYNKVQRERQQLRAARRQWENYRLTIPKDTPKTFQGFQNLKRSNRDGWEAMKKKYKEAKK